MSYEASTNGWDTVFAIPIARVNAAILAQKRSPKLFQHTDPKTGFALSATFDEWQICRGGDGGLIKLALPLHDVVAIAQSADAHDWKTSRCTARVEIRLRFLTATEDPAIAGNEHHLRVNSTTSAADEAIAAVEMDWHGSKPPFAIRFEMECVIEDWCRTHLADFEHVFAIAELNDGIDTGAWSFCKPRVISYAYSDGDDDKTSLLAVLSMTSADSPPPVQQVSRFAIPPGCEAGFLISPKRLLWDLLLPVFETVWPNCKASFFEYQSDVLQLKSGCSFEMPSFEHMSATYTPRIETLRIRVEQECLRFDSYSTCPISPGITSTNRSTHFYVLKLVTKDGQQTLSFEELAEKRVEVHDIAKSQEIKDMEEATMWVAIVGGIFSALLTAPTAGWSLLIGGIVFGLLGGLPAVTMSMIDYYHRDDARSVDMLVIQATSPIRWAPPEVFVLQFAGLNGALQLGGDWVPK